MIFTHVDRELCVVYPPYFVGPERLAVLHRQKGEEGVREMPEFLRRRAARWGCRCEPVFAGGNNRTTPGAGAVELGLQLPRGAARARS